MSGPPPPDGWVPDPDVDRPCECMTTGTISSTEVHNQQQKYGSNQTYQWWKTSSPKGSLPRGTDSAGSGSRRVNMKSRMRERALSTPVSTFTRLLLSLVSLSLFVSSSSYSSICSQCPFKILCPSALVQEREKITKSCVFLIHRKLSGEVLTNAFSLFDCVERSPCPRSNGTPSTHFKIICHWLW